MILEVSSKEGPLPLAPRIPPHHYAALSHTGAASAAGAIAPPMLAPAPLHQARTAAGPQGGGGRRKRKPVTPDASAVSMRGHIH